MIHASILEQNGYVELLCTGHAGYAEMGKDIVCAAVSSLSTSFINLCTELGEKGDLEVKDLKLEPGRIQMRAYDPKGNAIAALKMLEIGLTGISEEYPEYVMLHRCNRVGCMKKINSID